MIYYASLTKALLGFYYPIQADSELEARLKINTSSLKSLWCEVYTKEEVEELIKRYGGTILPIENPEQKLDYDMYVVQKGVSSYGDAGDG